MFVSVFLCDYDAVRFVTRVFGISIYRVQNVFHRRERHVHKTCCFIWAFDEALSVTASPYLSCSQNMDEVFERGEIVGLFRILSQMNKVGRKVGSYIER